MLVRNDTSVIPARAELERMLFVSSSNEYGHRLYVVMARHDTTTVGEEVWAGWAGPRNARPVVASSWNCRDRAKER